MKNKITDLNDHLFAQLERLSDEEISEEKLAMEINRSKAISSITSNIIQAAAITLKAAEFKLRHGLDGDELPPMLEDTKKHL